MAWATVFAFGMTIAVMVGVIFGVWHSPTEGWFFLFYPSDAIVAAKGLQPIGWPWYAVIRVAINLGVRSNSPMWATCWKGR